MPKPGIGQSVKLLWYVGIVAWCPMVLLLWLRLYEAQTFAQASLGSRRLTFVAVIGMFWLLTGSLWLARLRKAGKS
jgi:hypothetical protein